MSRYKRLTYLMVILMLLISSLSAFTVSAADASLTLGAQKEARPGDVFNVNLNISGGHKDLSSFSVTINYEVSKLNYKSCVKGGSVSSNTNYVISPSNGSVVIECTSDSIPSSILTLAVLSFEVKADAAVGEVKFYISSATNFNTAGENRTPLEVDSSFGTTNIIAPLSADATLSAFTVTGYGLSPSFNSTRTAYTLNVPYEITSLQLMTTATEATSKISVTGGTNLKVGTNTVRAVVTAPDGNTTKTYTILVTRQSDPSQSSSAVTSAVSSEVSSEAVSSSVISDFETSSATTVEPQDSITSLENKYERLEEKLFVVIVLFTVAISALVCYVVYLLIKSRK